MPGISFATIKGFACDSLCSLLQGSSNPISDALVAQANRRGPREAARSRFNEDIARFIDIQTMKGRYFLGPSFFGVPGLGAGNELVLGSMVNGNGFCARGGINGNTQLKREGEAVMLGQKPVSLWAGDEICLGKGEDIVTLKVNSVNQIVFSPAVDGDFPYPPDKLIENRSGNLYLKSIDAPEGVPLESYIDRNSYFRSLLKVNLFLEEAAKLLGMENPRVSDLFILDSDPIRHNLNQAHAWIGLIMEHMLEDPRLEATRDHVLAGLEFNPSLHLQGSLRKKISNDLAISSNPKFFNLLSRLDILAETLRFAMPHLRERRVFMGQSWVRSCDYPDLLSSYARVCFSLMVDVLREDQ